MGEAKRALVFDLYARGEGRVNKTFSSVGKGAKGLGDQVERTNKGLGKMKGAGGVAAAGLAGAGLAAGGLLSQVPKGTHGVLGISIQTAKAKVVFGSSFGAVNNTLGKTAAQFGITRTEGLGLAATFADMAKQQGFATGKAASMSTTFVDLAGRVKFLSAGQFDAAGASEALSAAFRGEYDSLQRVVPAISAARVEQTAMQVAGVKTKDAWDKLSTAEQQQASTLAVLKIVQGGVATSSALMASEEGKKALAIETSRTKMREQWQTLQSQLLPAMTELWSTLSGRVVPQLQRFGQWLSSPEGQGAMVTWGRRIGEVIGFLGQMLTAFERFVRGAEMGRYKVEEVFLQFAIGANKALTAVFDLMRHVPGIGDSMKKAGDTARADLAKLQGRLNTVNTRQAQLQADAMASNMRAKSAASQGEIGRLQGRINALRGKVVDAKTSKPAKEAAEREIRQLQGTIDRLRGKTVTITANAALNNGWSSYAGPGGRRFATGGPVLDGSGQKDDVPALLKRDEHVWTDTETAAVGGHGAMYRLRAAARRGQLRGFARGGAVGGSSFDRVGSGLERGLDQLADRFAAAMTRRLAALAASMDGTGGYQGAGGGSRSGLVAFGRWLQSRGYTVSEHPAFGGVGTHSRGSAHYSGRAIDVNRGAGTSSREQAYLRQIIGPAHAAGFKTIFMAPGHYNHAHIAMANGGTITEPIAGRGLRSGRTYSFGENGPERVTPLRGATVGATIHYHFHFTGPVFGSRADFERMVRETVGKGLDSGRLRVRRAA